MPIDGVAKISLRANIFAPGRIDHTEFYNRKILASIDGVVKMSLQANIFTPGRIVIYGILFFDKFQ